MPGKWFVTGRDVPLSTARFVGSPLFALAVALLGFVLAGAISVWGADLSANTQRVFEGTRGAAHVLTWLFWVGLLFWVLLLYARLVTDNSTAERLQQAIHRCPNPRLIPIYDQFFRRIEARLTFDEAASASDLAISLRAALREIANLAAAFANSKAVYGANIMLIETATTATNEQRAAMHFFDSKTHRLETLKAILVLTAPLMIHSNHDDDGDARQVPVISLPVPSSEVDEKGHLIVLPGAPFSLLTGKLSVYEDSSLLAPEWCRDFAAAQRDEVAAYFGKGGAGADIKSLLSLRIGDDERPVGVLNLDCNETHLLGPVADYYTTFHALLLPLVTLLRAPVEAYSRKMKVGQGQADAVVSPSHEHEAAD